MDDDLSKTKKICEIDENKESKDFFKELQNYPQVVEYIQKLEEQLKSQQETILQLNSKLTVYECEASKEIFTNTGTQTDWSQSQFNDESTDQNWIANCEQNFTGNTSIADQVAEAASSAMLQTGFVYEETTGLYYHYQSGYYYDAKLRLYYDGNSGIYYYYDEENKSYKFHSQVPKQSHEVTEASTGTRGKRRKKRNENKDKNKKRKWKPKGEEDTTESEEGECSSDESEESSEGEVSSSSSENNYEVRNNEDIAKEYPPCMRIIVKETNLANLKVGSLFIVTCTGGSIGREGDHSVIIPDINISKHHAKLQYNTENKLYEIIDLGSRNGTLLNGKRLSVAKRESDPVEIVHGSILQLGLTKLLCHVHNGHETCGFCEPGLVQIDSVIDENSRHLKSQYQKELKRLKSKFGLEQDNVEMSSRVASGYQDRAQLRRDHVGSSSQYSKTQQSSLDESISKDNKGFKMLSKMGWSEGKSLGKSEDGIKEPVPLVQTVSKAGLGASDDQFFNIQIDPSVEKKQSIWKKTQQRFNNLND